MMVRTDVPLNVLFVTQDDPFYLPVFFRELGSVLDSGRVHVIGVVVQRPLGRKTLWGLIRTMEQFYGPWNFLRVGVRYAVHRILGLIAVGVFRGNFPGSFSVRHVLLKNGWTILPYRNVNSDAFLAAVRELHIDLLVSAAASQIFKDGVLSLPRYGCLNVHTAKLPKNRGMMPNFWSLYHWDIDPVSAVTVHKMNAGLDDGPIILQEEFRLDPSEPLHRLTIRTKIQGAQVMARAITLFCEGEPPSRSNDRDKATYNSFPTREDVRRFRAKGLSLL